MSDEYVYDEATGEWVAGGAATAVAADDDAVVVRDSVGNVLADGDQVTLIKDLTVKGAGQTLKRGTLIKSITEKLLPLGDDVGFICGHGPGSSIGQERMTNPFLTGEM